MPPRIITLTTDFGLKDTYVAQMKASILSLNAKTVIVDITHEVEKFNIRQGSFVLASAIPFFPIGTIHVAVVDPGVGGCRRPIIIETKRSFMVGPDNGLMAQAANHEGILSIHEISNSRLTASRVSNTFHGRDVFAPAAAHLAKGEKVEEFGPKVKHALTPDFAKAKQDKDSLIGEVLYIDYFGNIITNISENDLNHFKSKSDIRFELSGQKFALKLSKTYADAKPQKPLALIGSHNYLEIAINQGNAAQELKAKTGDQIKIFLNPKTEWVQE
jgi:S-adenosylmethionine hydrolase